MDTFVSPIPGARFVDSGGIKMILPRKPVKSQPPADDKEDVRLPEGPYRLILHCRNGAGNAYRNDDSISKK